VDPARGRPDSDRSSRLAPGLVALALALPASWINSRFLQILFVSLGSAGVCTDQTIGSCMLVLATLPSFAVAALLLAFAALRRLSRSAARERSRLAWVAVFGFFGGACLQGLAGAALVSGAPASSLIATSFPWLPFVTTTLSVGAWMARRAS
jgi:hypothetical protein